MTLTLTDREARRGWIYLFLYLLVIPNGITMLGSLFSIRSAATLNLMAFFLNAVLAAVFFRELLGRSWENNRWGRTLWTAAKGFALYWLLSGLVLTLIRVLKPDYFNINDTGVNALIDEAPVLMPLAVVFAAPLAEECLFRGWLFTGLARKSLPLAYAVTAVFFSAIHVVGYIGSYDVQTLLLCFSQYLVPSIVLCRTCQKADSLLSPLLLHMTINTIALFTTR